MAEGQIVAQAEAEPRSLTRGLGGEEWVEDMEENVVGDSRPAVRHPQGGAALPRAGDVLGSESGTAGSYTPSDLDVSVDTAPVFATACASGGFT